MAASAPTTSPTPVSGKGSGPDDPTALTTQALFREVDRLEKLFAAQISTIEQRLDRMQMEVDKLPGLRHESIDSLKAFILERFESQNEKFNGIAIQFKERDTREERTSREGKEAIAAALQAQKEAVGKTETGFTEQIKQLGTLVNTSTTAIDQRISSSAKNSDDKISDIKERLTAIEAQKKGAGDLWGLIVGGVGLIVGAIAIARSL